MKHLAKHLFGSDFDLDKARLKDSKKHFEEHYSMFLKTQKGLQYLIMKYPNLSITEAINEYLAEAWIIENSNLT